MEAFIAALVAAVLTVPTEANAELSYYRSAGEIVASIEDENSASQGEQVEPAPVQKVAKVDSPETFTRELVAEYAIAYGVKPHSMIETIRCETGNTFDPLIQSFVPSPHGPNGREDSWGLSQIHLPSHPDITRAQAQDPRFAVEFMAQEFAKDNAWKWACWKLLKYEGKI